MLPEKGSASEGSAVFSGDFQRSVCVLRESLKFGSWKHAKGKALNTERLPRKKEIKAIINHLSQYSTRVFPPYTNKESSFSLENKY